MREIYTEGILANNILRNKRERENVTSEELKEKKKANKIVGDIGSLSFGRVSGNIGGGKCISPKEFLRYSCCH